ncbi:YmiA family putative membrane protein [Serratia rubidaea]|nr:YmiA family putative membrane protein [Serratia rubidaea]MCR0996778.1 YmiA family putative membrane protein [Serratia rubidaea]
MKDLKRRAWIAVFVISSVFWGMVGLAIWWFV